MNQNTSNVEGAPAVAVQRVVSRPDLTQTKWYIRPVVELVRDYGINACEAKAQQIASVLRMAGPMANVGGGRNKRWPNAECVDAMHERELDFNTRPLPFKDESLSLVVCEQVIEHLHNTTYFIAEIYRVLKPGGTLLLSTENLASIPNLFALLLQKAPFSTQALCGQFLGGWKDGPAGDDDGVATNHPTYAGVHGHVRVMTVGQLKALCCNAGFHIVNKWGFGGNHYVLLQLNRPANIDRIKTGSKLDQYRSCDPDQKGGSIPSPYRGEGRY